MTTTQGSADFISNQFALVRQYASFDPEGRQAWVREFQGTQTGIDTLNLALSGTGVRVETDFAPGGMSRLVATYYGYVPGSPEAEVPTDIWAYEEIETLPSIWTQPKLAPIIVAHPEYKKWIEDAIRDGTGNPFSGAVSGDTLKMKQLFEKMNRNEEGWWQNRPTLRRSRWISTSFAPRMVPALTTTVYSRASLITEFDVPSGSQPLIPVDPSWAAPSGTTWGWRKGPQSGQYNPVTQRYEETQVFTGAFWEDDHYDFE